MAEGHLNKEIITPAEASGIAQAAYEVAEAALPMTAVMPDRSNGGKSHAAWTPNLAPMETDTLTFRSWDAETPYTHTEENHQEMSTKLLSLTGRMAISERDVIDHTNNPAWMKERASQILTTLGRRAALLMETARVSVLVDGKLTCNTPSLHATWDFKRSPSLNVTAAKPWSDPDSDPIKDIKRWVNLVRKENGGVPRAAMTTSDVIDELTVHPKIIGLYTARSADNPVRIPRAAVLQVLSQYVGLVDVRMADVQYQDVCEKNGFLLPGGVNNLFPDNTFVLLSSFNDQNLGYTLSGPTAEAEDSIYEIGKSENSGLIGALFVTSQPVRYDVYVNGSALPILVRANSTLKATLPAANTREFVRMAPASSRSASKSKAAAKAAEAEKAEEAAKAAEAAAAEESAKAAATEEAAKAEEPAKAKGSAKAKDQAKDA